jgi:hypothetical protein
VVGKGRAFIGTYAGRLGAEDEFKAQLGIVWKTAAIEAAIAAKVTGESSFQMAPT